MKNKHNHMREVLLTGFVGAVASQALKPIVDEGLTILKSNLFYSVNFSDNMYDIGIGLNEMLNTYPDRVEFHTGESHLLRDAVKFTGMTWGFSSNFSDFFMYEGTPILVKINKFAREEHHQSSPDGAYFITFNNKWCKQGLKKFIRELYHTSRRAWLDDYKERVNNVKAVCIEDGRVETNWVTHKLRTFDDVFLPKKQKDFLIESLDAYVNNREFYIKSNIPNHFGVLLYSKPGHGKSSIAQAIAEHLNAELIVVNGDAIKHIHEVIEQCMGVNAMDDSLYRVLLFEDIDSGLFNLTRESDKKEDGKEDNVGMATILNALDGIGAPTNVIYVFTTNHVETLDPAFIRPGRCDIHLEIGQVTGETLEEFLKFHFPDEDIIVYDNYDIKKDLTFAELQTLVMKGKTAKEIVKYAYNMQK